MDDSNNILTRYVLVEKGIFKIIVKNKIEDEFSYAWYRGQVGKTFYVRQCTRSDVHISIPKNTISILYIVQGGDYHGYTIYKYACNKINNHE